MLHIPLVNKSVIIRYVKRHQIYKYYQKVTNTLVFGIVFEIHFSFFYCFTFTDLIPIPNLHWFGITGNEANHQQKVAMKRNIVSSMNQIVWRMCLIFAQWTLNNFWGRVKVKYPSFLQQRLRNFIFSMIFFSLSLDFCITSHLIGHEGHALPTFTERLKDFTLSSLN